MNPSVVSEPRSIRSVGAIRTQGFVGVDIFVATFPRAFLSLRYGGIEADRTNFTRPRTRDWFHD